MDERHQNHALANLSVLQTDPARESWFCIDNQTSRAFLRELIVIERKERLKLRQWQTNNSKICFHGDTINDPVAAEHPILAPIFCRLSSVACSAGKARRNGNRLRASFLAIR